MGYGLPPTEPIPTEPTRHRSNEKSPYGFWWFVSHYRKALRRTVIFVIIFFLFGVSLARPANGRTEVCAPITVITVPTDINKDGFIDCRSDQELGRVTR